MEVINWKVETMRPKFTPDGTQSGMQTGTIDIIVPKGETPLKAGCHVPGHAGNKYKVLDVVESRPAKGEYTMNNRPTFQRLSCNVVY